MKTEIPGLLLVGLLAAALSSGCSKDAKDQPAVAPSEKSAETPSRLKHGTNGEVIITLDAATQKVMGLQTTPLEAARLSLELKGYGHVLDISPLASMVAELSASRASSQASQAELKRL